MNILHEIKTRLAWLVIGLVASLMIAHVISNFEEVLQENIILASFIPLIVYMSDAVGTQMEAMIISELNNNKKKFKFRKFMRFQMSIVIPVALIIGLLASVALQLWHQDYHLSITIGLSLIAGIMSSLFTGAVLPYLFWKLHEDPAQASGPIATVLQDLFSVIVFFYIAQLFF